MQSSWASRQHVCSAHAQSTCASVLDAASPDGRHDGCRYFVQTPLGSVRHSNSDLPEHDLGLSFRGHYDVQSLYWQLFGRLIQGHVELLVNFLGSTITILDYSAYLARIHQAEMDGQLTPG